LLRLCSQIPKLSFVSKAKPSLYAYPAPLTVPTKEVVQTVATAVLSTTAKANARAKEKKKVEFAEEKMDIVSRLFSLSSGVRSDLPCSDYLSFDLLLSPGRQA